GDFGAVLHRLADDDRVQAAALRVRRRRAHAGARGAAGDQERVDALPDEMADEGGSREGAGVLFPEDVLRGQRRQARVDLAGALVASTGIPALPRLGTSSRRNSLACPWSLGCSASAACGSSCFVRPPSALPWVAPSAPPLLASAPPFPPTERKRSEAPPSPD